MTNQKSKIRNRKSRRGFTLIELLVVITIIGILAALLIPTLAAAVVTVQEGAVNAELQQLNAALTEYSQKYGEPPPDCVEPNSNQALPWNNNVTYLQLKVNRVRAHLDKVSSRNREDYVNDQTLLNTIAGLSPDEALVFWLGGGLYTNAEYPVSVPWRRLAGATLGGEPIKFFDFAEDRLVDLDGDGFPSFIPKHGPQVPYVYFDAGAYRNISLQRWNNQDQAIWGMIVFDPSDPNRDPNNPNAGAYPEAAGLARPYADSTSPNVKFHGENTFQIIVAGFDGHYGLWDPNTALGQQTPKFYPNPTPNTTPLTAEERDNQTSFSNGRMDNVSDF